jgi:hypothetical protein
MLDVYNKNNYHKYKGFLYQGLTQLNNTLPNIFIIKYNQYYNNIYSLHTPFGEILLGNGGDNELAKIMYSEIMERIKGYPIIHENKIGHGELIVTHIDNIEIQHPPNKNILLTSAEVYETYYKKNIESLQWEETKTFYNNEIKLLIYNKTLTDDMGILQKLYNNPAYYSEAINILSPLNIYDSSFILEMHRIKLPYIYSHIFGLLISAHININVDIAQLKNYDKRKEFTITITNEFIKKLNNSVFNIISKITYSDAKKKDDFADTFIYVILVFIKNL